MGGAREVSLRESCQCLRVFTRQYFIIYAYPRTAECMMGKSIMKRKKEMSSEKNQTITGKGTVYRLINHLFRRFFYIATDRHSVRRLVGKQSIIPLAISN